MATIPDPPAQSGALTVAITAPAGGFNYTQAVYSQADAQRIFNAWKNKVGPRDDAGNPTGTVKDFTLYLGQMLQSQVNSWISAHEATVVTPPNWTVSSQ